MIKYKLSAKLLRIVTSPNIYIKTSYDRKQVYKKFCGYFLSAASLESRSFAGALVAMSDEGEQQLMTVTQYMRRNIAVVFLQVLRLSSHSLISLYFICNLRSIFIVFPTAPTPSSMPPSCKPCSSATI